MKALAVFLLGCAVGFSAFSFVTKHDIALRTSDVRGKMSGSTYTNQLLECAELPEAISIGQRLSLQKEIEDRIAQAQKGGSITDAAVYFRDLNNGPWFGVNESLKFYPASLLKVPLAITLYEKGERDPSFLLQRAEYERIDTDVEAEQAFGSSKRLEDKKIYSVEELITFMLQESSNTAALLLSQLVGEENILTVYSDFGIPKPALGADYQIDTHTFASFFRILFNATYLDRYASEKLLGIMTRSAFVDGIVAGVPSDVVVAHKFGTREIDGKNLKQLHDCGIVYVPNNPYILCVMTQGKDFKELASFIKDTSSLVYHEVTK